MGDDPQVDLFILPLKLGHFWQKPQRSHGGTGGDCHLFGALPMANLTGGLCHLQQGSTHRFIVLNGSRAQVNRTSGALEQDLAQIIFKQPNLSADRTLRHVQLVRSQGETQMTCRRFKRDQTIKWR
ncbi:hypothetical protein D3C85_1512720 [compost metagenome]